MHCIATSFADPQDIARFKRCKASGRTDRECFKVGDNAVGLWGDFTNADRPICALPPDDWSPFYHTARGKLVRVRRAGKEVVCELLDTLPPKKNIRNGAGIDLNPAACAALGLVPPIWEHVEWEWYEERDESR